MENKRYTNPSDISAWCTAVNEGRVPEPEILSVREQKEEMILLALRTVRGLDLEQYCATFGERFEKENFNLLKIYTENGLAKLNTDFFALTDKGMLVSNTIIASLL